MGKNGEATLNNNGRKLIDFCTFNNLKIMNTFFKHKEIHKFTWEARGHKSIIDYFITNMKTSKVIQDIRVYRSNEIDSGHYLLCAKVSFIKQIYVFIIPLFGMIFNALYQVDCAREGEVSSTAHFSLTHLMVD